VSSHLLVSFASGSATQFGSSATPAPTGESDFAALLDTAPAGASQAPGALKSTIENLIGTKVASLAFEAGALTGVRLAGQDETLSLPDLALQTGIDLEALTALEAPADNTDPTKLLTRLTDLLANLGEPPEHDDLEAIGETLDALAAALDLPLTQPLTPERLAEIGARQLVEGASLADKLKGALADIAGGLITGAEDSEALEARIGSKLGAFIAALEEAGDKDDLLMRLGFATKAEPADADLEASITALITKPGGKTTIEPQPAQATSEPHLDASEHLESPPQPQRPADETGTKPNQPVATAAPTRTEPKQNPTDTAETASLAQATTRTDIAPGPKPVVTGYQTSQQQLNLPQIAFEIVRQVNQGNSQFQIRLDPPELGRIDVRMDIDKTGNVHARLTVEKSETLDLMQRDQRALERALAQAGLDSSKTSLEFSLKQNPFAGQGQDRQHGNGAGPVFSPDAAEAEERQAPTVNLYRGALTASGVNIFV